MNEIILILILQLCYVPMLALRTISMVKKLTLLTAIFGFLESLIYVFGLAIVISGEQSILQMLVYALGFGLGLVVGIHIEKKIAIGYTSVVVNISQKNDDLIDYLRLQGFGVTVFQGEGKDSARYRMDILTKRNREIELMGIIDHFEPTAFVIVYEPTRFQGGYLTIMMKKQSKVFPKGFIGKKLPPVQPEEPSPSWIKKTAEEIAFELKELASHDASK